MKILYINKQKMYSVEQDDGGRLYLCVVIGDIAMSEKRVPMDEYLTSLYLTDPNGLVERVNQIRKGA
jgi:predicted P-loop ATPase